MSTQFSWASAKSKGGKIPRGVVMKTQSRIMRALHDHLGKKLFSGSETHATDIKRKRALVAYRGAGGARATARVPAGGQQGLKDEGSRRCKTRLSCLLRASNSSTPTKTVDPVIYLETLVFCLSLP